jgi:hypothetical protein
MPEKCRVGDYDEVYNLTYALDLKSPVYNISHIFKYLQLISTKILDNF